MDEESNKEKEPLLPIKIFVMYVDRQGGHKELIEVPARHIRGDMFAVLLPDNEYAAWVIGGEHYVSRFRTLEEFQLWGWLPSD